MGGAYNGERIKNFELGVHPVKRNPEDKRGLIATVSETKGLYTLEIYFTQIPLKTLQRLLR